MKNTHDKFKHYTVTEFVELYNFVLKNVFINNVDIKQIVDKNNNIIYDSKYKGKKSYQDPDSVYSKLDMYSDLTKFLNNREEQFNKDKKLNSYFLYELDKKGTRINVYEYRNGSKGRKMFKLLSDQFGFSATPHRVFSSSLNRHKKKNIDSYPLSKYLLAFPNKYKYITKFVSNSRSLGGAFLWPANSKNQNLYNIKRGNDSYIEDRVDLTLNEIKQYYGHKIYKNNILSTCLNYDMITWLDHFKTFSTYSNYFCFDLMDSPFVNSKNNKIVDITDNRFLDDYEKGKVFDNLTITDNKDSKRLEYTLKNLEKRILRRTIEMEKIKNKSK